ncbi:hypothetical protein HII31_08654 [Pseudocercospora fuligena]|uniref:Uncharacterized protein n=1 Tax=Pseudocercospora fuligena TaxID=685502 RepID=A0A8H6RFU7_9PEZI|nr:hypothetical protein HII31_08654 [Pseudocercospora fuligena]
MSDQYPKRRVVKVREQDSGSYEFASLVWAMHILHYLSKSTIDGKGKPRGQPPLLMNEGAHHATGNTTKLGKDDSWENSKAKLLDCIAEAISSSRGWAMVTVTALRESETEVVIDVVTNAGWDYSGTDEEYHRLYTSNDRDFFDSVEEFISDIRNGFHAMSLVVFGFAWNDGEKS